MPRLTCLRPATPGHPAPQGTHLDGLKAPVPGAAAFLLLQLRCVHALHGRRLPCPVPSEFLHRHSGCCMALSGHGAAPLPPSSRGRWLCSLLRSAGYSAALGLVFACPPCSVSWAPACCSALPHGLELPAWEPDPPESPWTPCCVPQYGKAGASPLMPESLRMHKVQWGLLLQPGKVPLP